MKFKKVGVDLKKLICGNSFDFMATQLKSTRCPNVRSLTVRYEFMGFMWFLKMG